MSARAADRLAWSLLALALAMIAASGVFWVINDFRNPSEFGTASAVLILLPATSFAVVGALLASRHPRNAVGWISLGCGLAFALRALTTQYALFAVEVRPGALPAAELVAWFSQWDYLLFVVPAGIYLVMLFPNGRLPSSRWRPLAWAGGLSALVAGVSDAILAGPLYSYPAIENPYGVPGVPSAVGSLAFLGMVSCIFAAAVSMVRRLRRARGTERQQLKWFAFAASALAIVFFPVVMLDVALDPNTDRAAPPLALLLAQDVVTALFAGLPIATGIAITRYRLYDIDVVINRTLVYGSLTATLAGAYLCMVLLLQLALNPLTGSSNLAIAGSTLAVAALFQPARRRIQSAVDRRFYRRKYDAARTLERFGARLRDEVDIDALAEELRAVVTQTMQPAHVSLWLRVSR